MITYKYLKQYFHNKNHCWSHNYGNNFQSNMHENISNQFTLRGLNSTLAPGFVKFWAHNLVMVTIMLVNIKLTK